MANALDADGAEDWRHGAWGGDGSGRLVEQAGQRPTATRDSVVDTNNWSSHVSVETEAGVQDHRRRVSVTREAKDRRGCQWLRCIEGQGHLARLASKGKGGDASSGEACARERSRRPLGLRKGSKGLLIYTRILKTERQRSSK